MKPLFNPLGKQYVFKYGSKSKNYRKARWSRLLLKNEKRTLKKAFRQLSKKEINTIIVELNLWKY